MSYDATGFGFILGSLDDTDKHIEVADEHHIMAKKKGQVRH